MNTWLEIAVSVISSILASSGVWTLILRQMEKNDVKTEMLRGLAHDRIIFLGMIYINRGSITKDEYENLHDYLYVPYEKMNGNGSAKRIMVEVDKLPIVDKVPTPTTN